MIFQQHVFRYSLCILLLIAAGCGDGRPKRVSVSGIVTIDGKPLEYGFIQVLPAENRPAWGKLTSDGRFTLATFDDNDGCVLGKHSVVVSAQKALSSTTTRWYAPKKYADARTSGLEVEITGPRDDIEIKLTWAGSGHDKTFVEKSDSFGDEPKR